MEECGRRDSPATAQRSEEEWRGGRECEKRIYASRERGERERESGECGDRMEQKDAAASGRLGSDGSPDDAGARGTNPVPTRRYG